MKIIQNDGTTIDVEGDTVAYADGRVVTFERDYKKLRTKILRAIDKRQGLSCLRRTVR